MAESPRQHWMSILARADANALARLSSGCLPPYILLRGPEAGGILLRGRAGGSGAPFNCGEATVVRCSVRTEAGHVGHAYCLGCDLRQAELAAAIDAGLQDSARYDALQQQVIAPLAAAQQDARAQIARRAAATKVDFFTMATMRS